MKHGKTETINEKKNNSIILKASELHEDLWGDHERQGKPKKKKRNPDQYSIEYLVETYLNQQRNPFDYH